jgi:hypothetical protein
MTLTDWIVIGVIALVIGGAVAYIVKAKKSGKKCIGCPDSCACSASNSKNTCGGSCCHCTHSCETKRETE